MNTLSNKKIEKNILNQFLDITTVEAIFVAEPFISPRLLSSASSPCGSAKKEDIDLRQFQFTSTTSPLLLCSNNAESQLTLKSASEKRLANTTTSSHTTKVSFKIQKLFNKLEKSTENVSTVVAAAVSASSVTSSTLANASDLKAEKMNVDDAEDDAKKRPSHTPKEEEPLAKKSKSAKLDA